MTRHLLPLALCLFAAACVGPTDDKDSDTDVATDDTDKTADSPVDTAETDETDGIDTDAPDDTDAAASCKDAGGVCVGSGTGCTDDGGTVLAAFASDCVFDDGPGACCQPPAAAASGDTCADHGGVCAPIAGCDFVDGWFAPPDECWGSNGPGSVCCVPESVCGPAESECCGDGVVFRTSCDRGEETCAGLDDTELVALGECPVP